MNRNRIRINRIKSTPGELLPMSLIKACCDSIFPELLKEILDHFNDIFLKSNFTFLAHI